MNKLCMVLEEDMKKNIESDKSIYKRMMKFLEQADNCEDYSSLYLGSYIEKYVQSVFNVEIVPRKRTFHEKRPIDWIIDWKGKKLKVKHIISRPFFNCGYFYWGYKIDHNEKVDAFILSAFDTEFEPKYLWLIMSKEVFETRQTKKEFWDRGKLFLNDSEKVISQMKKYELEDELKKLKCIMERVRHEHESKEYQNDIRHIITRKQREIMDKTGESITRRYIIEKAIIAGIGKIDI